MPETLPDLTLVRNVLTPIRLRAAAAADPDAAEEGTAQDVAPSLGLMEVRFSPFNSWYRIDSMWEGTFLERSVPGAFKRTLKAHMDAGTPTIRSMFNHGMEFVPGEHLLGDVTDAREEPDSPVLTVDLWDTSYNRDLLPGLRSGAYGSSFMFRVVRDEWNNEPGVSDHNPEGLPERTMKEVRVMEAGPVTWPANPAATAGMRASCGTDAYYRSLERRDPAAAERARSALQALREKAPPANGTGAPAGPASAPPDGPATGHPSGLSPRARREALYPALRG